MAKSKKAADQEEAEAVVAEAPVNAHKELLEELHKTMVEQGIHSREQLEIMLTKL